MSERKKLAAKFVGCLDEISLGFIQAVRLPYSRKQENLASPLMRWLDFRMRYIDPFPRLVRRSKVVEKKLSEFEHVASLVSLIENMLRAGEDINALQGRGLTRWNDTSGSKRRERTDFLWANWGIHHLHLSDLTSKMRDGYAARSDMLLFCHVCNECVYLLDIRKHETDTFSDPELVKVLIREFPEVGERFRMPGVLAPRELYTAEETRELWRCGRSTFVSTGDKVYAPLGIGVTSASTATRVTQAAIKCRDCVRQITELVMDPVGEFRSGRFAHKDPIFSLALTPRGIAVYEERADIAWTMPPNPDWGNMDVLTILNQYISPAWVLSSIKKVGI